MRVVASIQLVAAKKTAPTLAELEDVLRRPKFDRYASLAQRIEFQAALFDAAVVIAVLTSIRTCRDRGASASGQRPDDESPTTRSPAATRCSARCPPTNPVTPVTSTRMNAIPD